MSSRDTLLLGIDLGGTKIEGVLMTPAGEVRQRHRVSTPRDDYPRTLAAIAAVADDIDPPRRLPLGIGTPGSVDAAGHMRNCNSVWLNGRSLPADLAAAVSRPVRIANDADCLALSESVDGAGLGAASVFAVILGTGVGGGFTVGGRLLTGPNGLAGEWGHTPLPYRADEASLPATVAALETRLPRRRCYCGRWDCVETYLSGPGLAETHRVLTGRRAGAPDIVDAADGNDTMAVYVCMLARALAQIVNVVDPAAIVLGGGLSRVSRLYDALPGEVSRHTFSDAGATRFAPAAHGDASGVRGAAWLWQAARTTNCNRQ